MKRLLLTVFIALFPIGLALASSSILKQAPTPTQVYISANTGKPVSVDTARVPTLIGAHPSKAAAELHELQQQFTQLNQLNLLFQQQTDRRLENLSSENSSLVGKMKKLDEAIGLLNQELMTLAKKVNPGQKVTAIQSISNDQTSPLSKEISYITQRYNQLIILLLAAIFVALLVLIMLSVLRRSRGVPQLTSAGVAPRLATRAGAAANKSSQSGDDDTKNEYDFMNSSEAIPAKLDLARAYLDMEDYPGAQEALKQVMAEGNAEQRQQAQDLINKIPK